MAPGPPSELMRALLTLAVPLHVRQLEELGTAEVEAIARECGAVVAAKGDLLVRPGQPGERAALFNALARGLAALSLTVDGGLVARVIDELCEAIDGDAAEEERRSPPRR